VALTADGPAQSRLDELSLATYGRPANVDEYSTHFGFSGRAELASLEFVAPLVRGHPILDVGIGAGRTIPLLRLLSDDYVGIDYVPEMVERCRVLYPGVDVQQGDARDMSRFEDGRFGFVMFSYNGIDSVDHQGRRRVLEEFYRVLRPGGVLVFSTHNKDGPAFRERPWRINDPSPGSPTHRTLRWLFLLQRRIPSYRRRWGNWWRNRRLYVDRGDWAMALCHPHDFEIALHFITLDAQQRELAEIGFEEVTAMGFSGSPITPETDISWMDSFHFIVRKPASP
jgi:SAM-dependent methyltransferase